MNYVGIDIHKRYSVCVAQDERGRRLGEARIEGNLAAGFAQFFRSLGGKSRVVIEACWNWQAIYDRSEEHTSELQSLTNLVCRLLLEKKKIGTGIPGLPAREPDRESFSVRRMDHLP